MQADKLKELAAQLQRPSGDKGLEMANMMHETNIKMTLQAIDQLAIADGECVLELGHGNCGHLAELLARAKNIHFTGLEISPLMQEEAHRINATWVESGNACFACYDGEKIPTTANHFDKIFSVNTIYFWKNPREFILELARVLKPNGLLAITFAESAFMKQLPFAQFGFTLYGKEDIKLLIDGTSLRWLTAKTETEEVRNKMGEKVNREYTTVLLQKADD